jgi:hypothetical protein
VDDPQKLRSRHLTGRVVVVVVVVLAVVAVGFVAVGIVKMGHRPGSGRRGGTDRSTATSAGSGPSARVLTPAPANVGTGSGPVVATIATSGSSLVIPSLGVDAPLVPTGATGSVGTAALTIPSDVHTVAWWDGVIRDGDRTVQEDAPKPGEPGVALIAGHIDSATAGPGALYDLKDLAPGALVEVIGSDQQVSTWRVSTPPDTTRKTALPPSLWVTTGPPKLALVTCGGPFDAATGHYLDNVIVWATPASG